jgi:hypothetical protein
VFRESFDYQNGVLTSVSGGLWSHSSGSDRLISIFSGQVIDLSAGTGSREDAYRLLGGDAYTTGVLYAGFDLTVSSKPVGNDYFFNFGNGSSYHSRVYIEAPTASGFRLGLQNDSNTVRVDSGDLALNSLHRLVLAYDVQNRTSRLWIDNFDEANPSLTDPTAADTLNVSRFWIRQGASGNIAGINIDNLTIARDFFTAVPEPAGMDWAWGLGLLSAWTVSRRRRWIASHFWIAFPRGIER